MSRTWRMGTLKQPHLTRKEAGSEAENYFLRMWQVLKVRPLGMPVLTSQ